MAADKSVPVTLRRAHPGPGAGDFDHRDLPESHASAVRMRIAPNVRALPETRDAPGQSSAPSRRARYDGHSLTGNSRSISPM